MSDDGNSHHESVGEPDQMHRLLSLFEVPVIFSLTLPKRRFASQAEKTLHERFASCPRSVNDHWRRLSQRHLLHLQRN